MIIAKAKLAISPRLAIEGGSLHRTYHQPSVIERAGIAKSAQGDEPTPIKRPGLTLLTNLITPDAIIPSLKANSKKQALQELSDRAAELSGLPSREILDALVQRERLGSTGTGDGVAIPHAKLARAKSMFGLFARLPRPIDFESVDGAPVDLIFLLVAPEIGWGRSSQSPCAPGAHVARSRDDGEASRRARRQCALFGFERGARLPRGLRIGGHRTVDHDDFGSIDPKS